MFYTSLASSQISKLKILGILFLTFTVLGAIHFSLIDLRILVPEDPKVVLDFIKTETGIFRLGILIDLILFTLGIILFVYIYGLVKKSAPILSIIALSILLVEIAITMGIELTSFSLLNLSDGQSSNSEILNSIKRMVTLRSDGYQMVTFLLGIGMSLNVWLLRKSGSIFSWMKWWGVISYSLLSVAIAINISLPDDYPAILGTVPSISAMVFQLFIGGYFLFRKT